MDKSIILQTRDLTAPLTGDVDATEEFSSAPGAVLAMIQTVPGETMFDGVATDMAVTHRFYIYFDDTVTSETWIEFNNQRFDILDVENLDERNMFMLLRATNRGVSSRAATGA